MLSHSKVEPVARDQIIDLGYYYYLLKSRWIAIFLFSGLCSSIAVLVLLSMTPVYRATATLLIEASTNQAISIEEVVGIDTSAKDYYQTQFEILRSNQVALRVIDKLGLINDPEFNPAVSAPESPLFSQWQQRSLVKRLLVDSDEQSQNPTDFAKQQRAERQRVLKVFKSKLTIVPIRNTQLVNIQFDSVEPELAALIADEVGHAYIENNIESKILATERATNWINLRLAELKDKLDESEQALLAFLQQQQLIDDSGIGTLSSSELASLTDRITQATEQRIETQALYNALKNSDKQDLTSLSSIPLISNHPQIRDIRRAESEIDKQVSELAKRYGPKHDKMIQARAQLESIQNRADQVIATLLGGIEQQLASAIDQEKLLKRELGSKKDEFQSLSVVKREYDALKREVDTNAKLYDLFLTRQKETSATSDFSSSNSRFSDYALVPESPNKPNKKLLLIIAMIASVGMAAVVVVMLDALNNTLDSARDVENKLGLLPTGTIPNLKQTDYQQLPLDNRGEFDERFSIFQQSMDTIRTSMMLSLNKTKRKVIAVSSAAADEGKTTTCIHLALSFAKVEKVLLIDCDLRKPTIAERFGCTPTQYGLVNHLVMNCDLDQCIFTSKATNLDVLTAGMLCADPLEILGGEAFANLLSSLQNKYERIIIDTAPIIPVRDSFLVGDLAEGLTIVLKANSTSKSVYRHTMALLTKHQIKIDGVILNQVNLPKMGKLTYSEYAAYGQQS